MTTIQYVPPVRRGYTTIQQLEFLEGLPLDDIAWSYIHAINPSCYRVIDAECPILTSDATRQRVTIYMKDDLISKITQEVEVGLISHENGYFLDRALREARCGQ